MCKDCVCHECEYRIDCDRCHRCNDGDNRIKSCERNDKQTLRQCRICAQHFYGNSCTLCGTEVSNGAEV